MTMGRLIPRRRWAGGTDQILLPGRYILVLGDVQTPDLSVFNEALRTIAAAGTHTRIGLIPRMDKRFWEYAPSRSWLVRQVPDTVDNEGTAAVLEHIRNRPGQRFPLEVNVSERHLAIEVDHGLGDGRFLMDLAASLLAVSRGEMPPWVTDPEPRAALLLALAHTFGRNPRRARRVWNTAVSLRSTDAVVTDDADHRSVPWEPSFAVNVTQIGPDLEFEVNRWRRANAPSAGSAATWLYITRRALADAGVQMTDRVMVAFDCRRYLPEGRIPNGNFGAGLEIHAGADETLAGVGARLQEISASALPLAAMAAVSTLTQVRRRSPTGAPSRAYPGAPARLMYSDLGRARGLETAPFHSDGDQFFTGLLDPSGPDGITIFSARVSGGRSVSMSFHDNIFDRQLIAKAAAHIEQDPIRLLERR
jgi:hypothetical protein